MDNLVGQNLARYFIYLLSDADKNYFLILSSLHGNANCIPLLLQIAQV
jgi:hypothetical protein